MTVTLIENASLVFPGESLRAGSLLVASGKIAAIDPVPADIVEPCERLDAHGALLTPGLIDIHCHGIHRLHFEQQPENLHQGSELLPQYGTTTVLPTLYALQDRTVMPRLEALASALTKLPGAAMPGFHLEGPFLALPGAGAATLDGDVGFLEELLAAAQHRVRVMSVSPETANILPVIERLVEKEIRVFMTHTRASVEETQAAIAAGATHATHFYDVFPVPEEKDAGVRPVGAVETLLADCRCSVDFICDGIHVHPMAIRAALAAKEWQKIIAITDANIGAGLPDDEYDTPWGYSIRVSKLDAARISSPDHPFYGGLAGSALTMNAAIANLLEWLPIQSQQVWAMGTCNPANLLGLQAIGTLRVGADADLVLWDQTADPLRPQLTWVAGRCVFDSNLRATQEDITDAK